MDAVHGTPVLDIKPYDHHDSVFSPDTPRFPSSDPQHRRERLHAQALRHHQEACRWLDVGLDLATQAEGVFGHLCDPALTVEIEGPPCLADVIQGLTAARFANPPRLRFTPSETSGPCRLAEARRFIGDDHPGRTRGIAMSVARPESASGT